MRPAKIQIRLHIHAVWSESDQGTFWTAKNVVFFMQTFLYAEIEDWPY